MYGGMLLLKHPLFLLLPNRNNLNRLVCVTSWGTQKEPGNPKLLEWFLKPLVMAGFIHDMGLMENMLMESKLCFTVVRPPGLDNGEMNYYYLPPFFSPVAFFFFSSLTRQTKGTEGLLIDLSMDHDRRHFYVVFQTVKFR